MQDTGSPERESIHLFKSSTLKRHAIKSAPSPYYCALASRCENQQILILVGDVVLFDIVLAMVMLFSTISKDKLKRTRHRPGCLRPARAKNLRFFSRPILKILEF